MYLRTRNIPRLPQVLLDLRTRDIPPSFPILYGLANQGYSILLCIFTAFEVYLYLPTRGIPSCTYEPGVFPVLQVFVYQRTRGNFLSSPSLHRLTNQGYFTFSKSSLLTTKDILRCSFLRITARPSEESIIWNAVKGGGKRLGERIYPAEIGLRLGRALVHVYIVNAWGNTYRHKPHNG